MTESKYEVCCSCGELTGRAGAGEDSLYLQEVGPFCEDCYEVCTSYAGIADAQLRQRITELQAEVERIKAQQHDAFGAYQQLAEKLATAMHQNMALEAEVERLKARRTAAEERAAVIRLLKNQPCEYDGLVSCHAHLLTLIGQIERGEHWPPEGGKP